MTYRLQPDVVVKDVEDGAVLLDQRDGRYWQLNRTGAAVLRLALEGRSPEETTEALAAGRADRAERVGSDVRALLGALAEARLVVRA
ncbi:MULTISPECIES: lasso peptide biosynthesis PqqD family chaperone [unclassified Streptomyces]|uniref:lasso peptide biosynthesis PqqD family chaperone n=1 Tax=unclassified Streptomyces TaxID=2593676 RepID=UPI002E37931C|nr:lasso peptide biosynthesis PqqD family chaperone [Streptomyces sp. NBC_01716]